MATAEDLIMAAFISDEEMVTTLERIIKIDLRMSIREFTERAGLSQSTIYKILDKLRDPSLSTLRELVRAIRDIEGTRKVNAMYEVKITDNDSKGYVVDARILCDDWPKLKAALELLLASCRTNGKENAKNAPTKPQELLTAAPEEPPKPTETTKTPEPAKPKPVTKGASTTRPRKGARRDDVREAVVKRLKAVGRVKQQDLIREFEPIYRCNMYRLLLRMKHDGIVEDDGPAIPGKPLWIRLKSSGVSMAPASAPAPAPAPEESYTPPEDVLRGMIMAEIEGRGLVGELRTQVVLDQLKSYDPSCLCTEDDWKQAVKDAVSQIMLEN